MSKKATEEIDWRFIKQNPSEGKKWGEGALYATPQSLESLVRETGQNSLDAGEGEKVTLRYTLFELSPKSQRYKNFLEAFKYKELEGHLAAAIVAAATPNGAREVAVRLKQGLLAMSAKPRPLRLLRVEDYGAIGLRGAEMDSNKPFAALLRDVSNSTKADQTAGGSYGLGSRTLWAASKTLCVLFSSIVRDEESKGVRVIAKSELSYHTLKGPVGAFAGRGFLGTPVRPDGADSCWLKDSSSVLRHLLVDRTPPVDESRRSGTSALVIAFSEKEADDVSAHQVVEDLAKAVALNFWPALTVGQLRASTECFVDDETAPSASVKVRPEDYVPSFVKAFRAHLDDKLQARLEQPGDVVSVPVTLTVPATRPEGGVEPQHPEVTAECRLVIRLPEPDCADSHLLDHVGFTRGRGMITRYTSKKNLVAGARSFHCALLAGTLVSTQKTERAAETFLRYAEPPAHNGWTTRDTRVLDCYAHGTAAKLKQFEQAVIDKLREYVRAEADETTDGPPILQELLRLRRTPQPPQPKVKLENVKAPYHAGEYHVSAHAVIEGGGPCVIAPRLAIEKESGRPIPLDWIALASPDASENNGRFVVAKGKKRIRFTGRAQLATTGLDPTRCAVRLSVVRSEAQEVK